MEYNAYIVNHGCNQSCHPVSLLIPV